MCQPIGSYRNLDGANSICIEPHPLLAENKNKLSKKMNPLEAKKGYIQEIDALRGLAVLLVVLYHAFPKLLPGGFIGVDVFFVISGFVISRTYLFPLINREISFKKFYLARLRRLMPAIIVVCIATASVSALFILPDRLMAFAWSLIGQVFYLQNFVFWNEGSYFSGALTKPLLHTWSLAIEEQFYLVWVLIILFFRKFPKLIILTLLIATGISLFAGFVLEGRSPKTVFFLLPFRVWEFAFGMLAYLVSKKEYALPPLFEKGALYACYTLIVLTAVMFNDESAFPGLQSLLACGATTAILVTVSRSVPRTGKTPVAPLQYLGKISYSLYLWHWPPLVLFFLYTGAAASAAAAGSLLLLALLGAAFSHHLIEQPIRRRQAFQADSTFIVAMGMGLVSLLAIGATLIYTNGLLKRFPTDIQPFFEAAQERGGFRCGQSHVLSNPSSEFCNLADEQKQKSKSILIVGDSHADVLKEMIADVGVKTGMEVRLSVRNCDLGRYGSLSFCNNTVLEKLISQAKAAGVTDIFAISYWETDKFNSQTFKTDLSKLTSAGFHVHVFLTVPSHDSYDPKDRAQSALSGNPLDFSGMSRQEHENKIAAQKGILSAAIEGQEEHVRLIDPSVPFCHSGQCEWSKNGIPYYLDTNHLTFTGGEVLRPLFGELFRSIKDRP